jgi:hypothetical protein
MASPPSGSSGARGSQDPWSHGGDWRQRDRPSLAERASGSRRVNNRRVDASASGAAAPPQVPPVRPARNKTTKEERASRRDAELQNTDDKVHSSTPEGQASVDARHEIDMPRVDRDYDDRRADDIEWIWRHSGLRRTAPAFVPEKARFDGPGAGVRGSPPAGVKAWPSFGSFPAWARQPLQDAGFHSEQEVDDVIRGLADADRLVHWFPLEVRDAQPGASAAIYAAVNDLRQRRRQMAAAMAGDMTRALAAGGGDPAPPHAAPAGPR